MKITACIIAKDEEAVIERCLKSLKGLEIVVLDTGSTDKTIEIAKKYATVYEGSWQDDFSLARNQAAEYATNKWILYLSADEYLLEGMVEKINALETEADAVWCHIGGDHNYKHARIYRKKFKFIGRVHEYLPIENAMDSDIEIVHKAGPNHHRDKDLDLRILTDSFKNSRNCYYLAREYYYRKDWKTAIHWFTACIEKSTWSAERSDTYLYLARCWWSLGRGDDARDCCLKAILLNPNFKEALNFMGEITWPEQGDVWKQFANIANNKGVLFIRN